MLGENGDKLVGEWKATVTGTIINCERTATINNGYICALEIESSICMKFLIINIRKDFYSKHFFWSNINFALIDCRHGL